MKFALKAKKLILPANRVVFTIGPFAVVSIRWEGVTMIENANANEQLAEDRRKEIFLAVVNAQDKAINVAQSRRLVAEQFGVSESQVRTIEREGMDNQWPPL